jgi:RNA polymerase sigma factor (sigma-70 family)
MSSNLAPTRETAASLATMHGRFLNFLEKKLPDRASAEDILQSAYLKAMQRGAQLRDTESTVAWFYRILRNAVADHYRQLAARSRALDELAAGWKEGYELELHAETCACISEVVHGLKPEYRAAIEQVDLAGGSVEAFAKSQSTTANNASVRLHRARKAVAKQLIAVCGICCIHNCIDCTCRSRQ